MQIRKYSKISDELKLLNMIEDEEGWDYADENLVEKYKRALDHSITYVAYIGENLCAYVRAINDCDLYIYICDLLVKPNYRGKDFGRKLMEYLFIDYPTYIIYVMSDVDEYYKKVSYKKEGSIFRVIKATEKNK